VPRRDHVLGRHQHDGRALSRWLARCQR
jgi:hypothetical protein